MLADSLVVISEVFIVIIGEEIVYSTWKYS